MFLKDPPPWRSLCKELTTHSKFKIRNSDIHENRHSSAFLTSLEEPETFCHFSPDAEDPIRHDGTELPKTIICHDMANGYHDDCYIDGTSAHDAYTFYNWAGVDIFCYFSHHLITIPPLSWINVGHAHGVKVIGTLITERTDGMRFWDQVLVSESEYQNFANALVAIANTLKFDGWLLNIENNVTKPDVLLEFVRYLNRVLHEEIPHAELIWYDSVTVNGHLNWQNGLNEHNRAFFDACDGLFTNYSWTEFNINSSVIEAGDRIRDLYIGMDVWGRNFYGGGEFNTQEAIKLVHAYGCSLAVFAPAWTYEAASDVDESAEAAASLAELDVGQRSLLRDRALWGSFWPFLNTRLPSELPFKTSFCRGQGMKRRLYGEVISPGPWFNLRHQQYQPNSAHGPHGYQLCPPEAVLAVSHHSFAKDPKGIIRYRESFRASHTDPLSVQLLASDETDDEDERAEPDERPAPSERASSSECAENRVQFTEQSSDDEESKCRRMMKKAFKNLFKRKSAEQEEGAERHQDERADGAEPQLDESAAGAEWHRPDGEADTRSVHRLPAAEASGGRSMEQMSVNLRLGQGRGRHEHSRVQLVRVPLERECLELWQHDAFSGGASLRVHPSDAVCHEHRHTRLFHCDFLCRDALLACVVTKTLADHGEQYLNVRLHVADERGRRAVATLVGRSVPHAAPAPAGALAARALSPLEPDEPRFECARRHMLLAEPGFYVPVENSFGWTVRYYEVPMAGSRVTSVNLRTGLEKGAILLGHFALCEFPSAEFPCA